MCIRYIRTIGSGRSLDLCKYLRNSLHLFAEQRSIANELRFKLIISNIGFNLNVFKVICTCDALYLHCLRVAVQTYLWRNSSQLASEVFPVQKTIWKVVFAVANDKIVFTKFCNQALQM